MPSIPTIPTTDLATVSGGAAPNVNPSGITAQDILNAKPADNRVIEGPSNNRFSSPDMRVTSPQDNSWMNRIPDMHRQLGM